MIGKSGWNSSVLLWWIGNWVFFLFCHRSIGGFLHSWVVSWKRWLWIFPEGIVAGEHVVWRYFLLLVPGFDKLCLRMLVGFDVKGTRGLWWGGLRDCIGRRVRVGVWVVKSVVLGVGHVYWPKWLHLLLIFKDRRWSLFKRNVISSSCSLLHFEIVQTQPEIAKYAIPNILQPIDHFFLLLLVFLLYCLLELFYLYCYLHITWVHLK